MVVEGREGREGRKGSEGRRGQESVEMGQGRWDRGEVRLRHVAEQWPRYHGHLERSWRCHDGYVMAGQHAPPSPLGRGSSRRRLLPGLCRRVSRAWRGRRRSRFQAGGAGDAARPGQPSADMALHSSIYCSKDSLCQYTRVQAVLACVRPW